MARKSIEKSREKELTLTNWLKKILVPLILMVMSGYSIYDNLPFFSALFAFVAGCMMPEYISFTKDILKSRMIKSG